MADQSKFFEKRNSKRKAIKWTAVILSSIFTYFWTLDFFGHEWWKIFIINPALTFLIMLILSYSIGQLLVTRNYLYMVPILLAVSTSLLGTTGTLMQGIVNQIMDTPYWSQLDEASRYVTSDLKALDNQSQEYAGRNWPRNQERVINKKQKSVDQLLALTDKKNDLVTGSTYTGAGALAYIARKTGMNAEDVFWFTLIIISLFVDCMFIETTVQENLEELGMKPSFGTGFLFWGKKRKPEQRQEEFDFSNNGGAEKKNNNLNSEAGVKGRNREMQKRINKLARLLESGYPIKPKRKLADKIDVSVETLNKYLELPEIQEILEEESIEI